MDRKLHPFGPLTGPHLQTAYVTNDLQRARNVFAERFGVTQFAGPNVINMSVEGRPMTVKTALAWVGPTMLELIEPAGGADDLYRSLLPAAGFAICHHHNAAQVKSEEEWADVLSQISASHFRIALQGDQSGVKFIYIDTYAVLHHYMEYLYFYDQRQFSLDAIPRN